MSRKHFLISLVVILILALAVSTTPVRADEQSNEQSNDQSGKHSVSINQSDIPSDFIPTHEWQEIAPGQSIPPGLWVRMDMTTGKKTARLLPEDEQTKTSSTDQSEHTGLVIVDKPSTETEHLMDDDDEQSINQSELRSVDQSTSEIPIVVENIPSESVGTLGSAILNELEPHVMIDYDPSTNQSVSHPVNQTALKALRAQRLRELAAHFSPTDDVFVMKYLINTLINQTTNQPNNQVPFEHMIQALESLESFVHQIDNAVDAVHLGLLDVLLSYIDRPFVSPSVDQSTNQPTVSAARENIRLMELQEKAAWLIGSASSNNQHVIKEARSENTIHSLIQLLERLSIKQSDLSSLYISDDQSINQTMLIDQSFKTQSKCAFALSSLIRGQPESQQLFLMSGGDRTMIQLVNQAWTVLQSIDQNADQSINQSINPKWAFTTIEKALSLISSVYDDGLINHSIHQPLFDAMISQSYCELYHQFDQSIIETLLTGVLSNNQSNKQSTSLQLIAWRVIESVLNIQIQLINPTSSQSICIHRPAAQQGLNRCLELIKQSINQSNSDETCTYWLETVQTQLQSLVRTQTASE